MMRRRSNGSPRSKSASALKRKRARPWPLARWRKTRRHGRSLGELLRGSQRQSRQQPRAPKPAKRAEHPLAAPSEPEPPAPPPTTRATPDVIFPSEEMGEGTPKIHPEELQVGAILTRSLVLASVVIGVVLLILLFLGG